MPTQLARAVVVGLALQQVAGTLSVSRSQSREFSCAAFPRDLSEAGLVTRYGRENVIAAPVFGSDDGPADGTIVFPDDEDAKLEIVWWDP